MEEMPKTPKPKQRETATAHMNVNFTPSEMRSVVDAAEREDGERFPSRWVRKVALRAARGILGDVRKAAR